MFKNKATSVKEYLDGLPDDRRKSLSKVRSVIKKHLPKGYKETINWGAITYEIPLETFPDTYNGQPLCYAALASTKHHNSLYLMGAYGDAAQRATLTKAFDDAGLELDMGKACVRFKDVDDLPLAAIGKLIAAIPPAKYIETYQKSRKK